MIRRLFIVAVSLAALTACTTYDSGYRNYQPAQAGYGDYYYAPDPGPSYYSPGYVNYPAYYSLYWGFDRHYYSSWRQPHFRYGVTWFPNDWFGFSVAHRYPRYSYWHPYAPYRYSAWDHRFAWHHYAPPPRYRYRAAPRYGHPSNARHMQREHLADGRARQDAPYTAGPPRARSALDAAMSQRLRGAPQSDAYGGPQSVTPASRRGSAPDSAPQARMRQQAMQEARESRLRAESGQARGAGNPAEVLNSGQRPWQQTQSTGRARTVVSQDAAPPRYIPDRRESQGPRQVMGATREAPVRQMGAARTQDPRMGDAPRARPAAATPVQQQRRMPAREDMRQDMRQAPRGSAPMPVAPRRNMMPATNAATATSPQPRMPRAAPAPAAVRQAAPPVRQAAPPAHQAAPPVRQAAPAPRPAASRPSGRARSVIERED